MHWRTIQRGIVALAVVASLSVAGSRPATAMDLGLLRHLSDLWSFVTGAPSHAIHRTTTHGKPVPQKACTPDAPNCERGGGIDPNGSTLSSLPTAPPGGN
jgi:hypothetical protein